MEKELQDALDAIEVDWNVAEEYIKKVERLRRGLVVAASINELRYAGRRMVEAYALAKMATSDPKHLTAAFDLLREVQNFCQRAKHDAVDGAVTYIDQALAKFEDDFGPEVLYEKFPDYIGMKVALRQISEAMSTSRGDRSNRDDLYESISKEIIPDLINKHYFMETSTKIFEAAIAGRVGKERREAFRFYLPTIIAFVAMIAGVVATILAISPLVKLLTESPPSAASSPSIPAKPGAKAPQQ